MNFNPFRMASFFLLPNKFNIAIGNPLGMHQKSFDFFVDFCREIISQRKQLVNDGGDGKRNDLVQLLMDAFVYEDELEGSNYDSLAASVEHGKKYQFKQIKTNKI